MKKTKTCLFMPQVIFNTYVQKFFQACAEGDFNGVKQCVEQFDSSTEIHLGMAYVASIRNEEIFDFLSKHALEREGQVHSIQSRGHYSYGINAMVQTLVHKNWREKLNKVLLAHPTHLLDTALDWTLEEFAENEHMGDNPNPATFSPKTKAVGYVIARVAEQSQTFPQSFETVKHLASETWTAPLFDYVLEENKNPALQQKICNLFSLDTAPPSIRSMKEKQMIEKSLKRGAALKKLSSFFKSQKEASPQATTNPASKKKM